jgi:hypothetical protein
MIYKWEELESLRRSGHEPDQQNALELALAKLKTNNIAFFCVPFGTQVGDDVLLVTQSAGGKYLPSLPLSITLSAGEEPLKPQAAVWKGLLVHSSLKWKYADGWLGHPKSHSPELWIQAKAAQLHRVLLPSRKIKAQAHLLRMVLKFSRELLAVIRDSTDQSSIALDPVSTLQALEKYAGMSGELSSSLHSYRQAVVSAMRGQLLQSEYNSKLEALRNALSASVPEIEQFISWLLDSNQPDQPPSTT